MSEKRGRAAGAAGAPAKRARPATAVDVSDGKLSQLWGSRLSKEQISELQLDATATFSVTDARTADRISAVALALEGVSASSHVIDGCACVGGNVISFARTFARVTAVELDETRHAMLANNVAVAGFESSVRCFHSDIARVARRDGEATATAPTSGYIPPRPALVAPADDDEAYLALAACDVLFMDPPWGGSEVGSAPMGSVELKMSGVTMSDLCRSVFGAFPLRHVLLKLPPNYVLDKLKADLADIADVTFKKNLRKMVLAVVSAHPAAAPAAPAVAEAPVAPEAPAVAALEAPAAASEAAPAAASEAAPAVASEAAPAAASEAAPATSEDGAAQTASEAAPAAEAA
ncbi:hypothetical protein M885DRAFT_617802 [Pelagophyceae sp. CCMP2097]|nr:hypothetical protein M885DRAFT_617802 [Pelagophyceae sp. CCMP2097]